MTELEKFEHNMETEFNIKFGFGIWRTRGNPENGIYSSDVLEWCRRQIQLVRANTLQEVRERLPKERLENWVYMTTPIHDEKAAAFNDYRQQVINILNELRDERNK